MIPAIRNNTQTYKNISFGTTSRKTNSPIAPGRNNISNNCCVYRGESDSPKSVANFLADLASQPPKIEWKVWGCSDMSQFLPTRILMQNIMGTDNFKKTFADIELIDIDEKMVNRNQKGLVGLSERDEELLDRYCGIEKDKYFTEITEPIDFFLKGEPHSYDESPIKPHRIAPELLENVKIRQGDIRSEIKAIPEPSNDTFRIFDFSNAWYFSGKEEQVDLACELSKKLKVDDVLMIGNAEKLSNISQILELLGFRRTNTPWGEMQTTLLKIQQLEPQELHIIKTDLLKKCNRMIRF